MRSLVLAMSIGLLVACAGTAKPAREGKGCPLAQNGSASPCDHRGGGPKATDAAER